MRIIGHRGAAGHELENTLASIQYAKNLGVYGVEFDLRKTKDNQLVLCHDADLQRVADDNRRLDELSLTKLQKIPLLTGAHIPTLAEALEVMGNTPCFIDLKDSGCAELLAKELARFPKVRATVLSYNLEELRHLRKLLNPNVRLFACEKNKPFEIINNTKRAKLDGISLIYWLLNPFNYYLAKREGFDMYVWTINRVFMGRLIHWFYPDVAICTDYPEKFLTKRRRTKSYTQV